MSANIPKKFIMTDLVKTLLKAGLALLHQGKVRDTFVLSDFPGLLLVVASDRISIFDFVLPAYVKNKGKVLTAMTVFWLTKVFYNVENHLVAHGPAIDEYLPAELRGNPELQSRALIIKELDMLDKECIVRGYLTGTGWKAYQKDGKVCGIKLPEGLHDGSELPDPIFTPTDKAKIGHDQHLDAADVVKEHGDDIKLLPLLIYNAGSDFAKKKGVIIADTKLELGVGFVLADEILTPDSSRFWLRKDWEEAVKQEKSPSGYDKEPVREWGKTIKTPFGVTKTVITPLGMTGINNLKPEIPEHVEFVHSLIVPEKVLTDCTSRYQEILFILTGQNLEFNQV